MNSTISVFSVQEFIQKIIEFPNFKYARGESREYDKPFLPGIWREEPSTVDRTPITSTSKYTIGELSILKGFQKKVISGEIKDPYFSSFIGDINKDIDVNSESLWHWTSFAQHYGEKTRLVDITSDSLTALYFASRQDDDQPGFVHIFMNNFNSANRNNLNLVEFGDTFFDLMAINEYIDDKHPVKPHDNTTAVISPSFPNRRVETQKGLFCFTREIDIQAYWGGQLTFEIINKDTIRSDLEKLGYTDDTVFPEEYSCA
ncbi:MAG: FRG domain-containing protein [Pseudomonadales bacterium]|nr:FRG domain-containing protein [Pseudomonadales bacterium]